MRLTLHARIEITLAAALLLGSCGGDLYASEFSDAEMDEIGDIVGDAIGDDETIADLDSRISEIEAKLNM